STCLTSDTGLIVINKTPKPLYPDNKDVKMCHFVNFGIDEAETINWSTGDNSSFINIFDSQTLTVHAYNSNGCALFDTINVTISKLNVDSIRYELLPNQAFIDTSSIRNGIGPYKLT